MRPLILLLLEIQIVMQQDVPALGAPDRRERERHLELAPAPLLDHERRVLERLLRALLERFVQVVGHFLEAVGRHVVAVRADEVDGDVPGAHGEVVDGGLVGAGIWELVVLRFRAHGGRGFSWDLQRMLPRDELDGSLDLSLMCEHFVVVRGSCSRQVMRVGKDCILTSGMLEGGRACGLGANGVVGDVRVLRTE